MAGYRKVMKVYKLDEKQEALLSSPDTRKLLGSALKGFYKYSSIYLTPHDLESLAWRAAWRSASTWQEHVGKWSTYLTHNIKREVFKYTSIDRNKRKFVELHDFEISKDYAPTPQLDEDWVKIYKHKSLRFLSKDKRIFIATFYAYCGGSAYEMSKIYPLTRLQIQDKLKTLFREVKITLTQGNSYEKANAKCV